MTEILTSFAAGVASAVLVCLMLLLWLAPSFDAGARQQERACHPGMFLEAISNGRVICVGGKGETWVVVP